MEKIIILDKCACVFRMSYYPIDPMREAELDEDIVGG